MKIGIWGILLFSAIRVFAIQEIAKEKDMQQELRPNFEIEKTDLQCHIKNHIKKLFKKYGMALNKLITIAEENNGNLKAIKKDIRFQEIKPIIKDFITQIKLNAPFAQLLFIQMQQKLPLVREEIEETLRRMNAIPVYKPFKSSVQSMSEGSLLFIKGLLDFLSIAVDRIKELSI